MEQWSYLGCQKSNSVSSSKFHHLALLVAQVSRSSNFHHWPLLALLVVLVVGWLSRFQFCHPIVRSLITGGATGSLGSSKQCQNKGNKKSHWEHNITNFTLQPGTSSVSREEMRGTCQHAQCWSRGRRMMLMLDKTVDPCHSLYEAACGGWVMNMSSSVMEEDLETVSVMDNHKLDIDKKIKGDNCCLSSRHHQQFIFS